MNTVHLEAKGSNLQLARELGGQLKSILCAGAVNAAACDLPKDCAYMDSEFSTGGGDKVSYLMEVTCNMPKDQIIKYTHWQVSIGSLFGMGRFTAPKKIVFNKGNGPELVCKY